MVQFSSKHPQDLLMFISTGINNLRPTDTTRAHSPSMDEQYSSCCDGMSSFCQHCTEWNRGNVSSFFLFCFSYFDLERPSYAVLATLFLHVRLMLLSAHKHDYQLFRVAASMSPFGQFQISTNITTIVIITLRECCTRK